MSVVPIVCCFVPILCVAVFLLCVAVFLLLCVTCYVAVCDKTQVKKKNKETNKKEANDIVCYSSVCCVDVTVSQGCFVV